MDPVTSGTISIATEIISSGGLEFVAELYRKLKERVEVAQKEYQDKPVSQQPSKLEIERQSLLSQWNEVQNEIILYVSDQKLLAKLMVLCLEQLLRIYEAESASELNLARVSLVQVRAYVTQFRSMVRRRAQARWAAVYVSIIALLILGGIIFWGMFPNGPSVTTVLPVLDLPLPVLLWAAIGSFTAILYRFNNQGDIELHDPLRWLFTRPLTGIVMGTVTFLIVKLGFLSVSSQPPDTLGTTTMLALIAFIAGFSDRFADNLIKSLIGRFGGDEKAGVMSLDEVASAITPVSPASILEGFTSVGKGFNSRSNQSKKPEEEKDKLGEDGKQSELMSGQKEQAIKEKASEANITTKEKHHV